jgi:hypothetical protein
MTLLIHNQYCIRAFGSHELRNLDNAPYEQANKMKYVNMSDFAWQSIICQRKDLRRFENSDSRVGPKGRYRRITFLYPQTTADG